MAHIPVLQKEVIEYLNPQPNENFIDCTIGEGGHTLAILEAIRPKGKVLGIDWQIRIKSKEKRLILVQDNFANLKNIVQQNKFGEVSGILFDLGMSSWHLEESGRGFSFKRNEPLDMRYDVNAGPTAQKIVNYWSKSDIEKILQEYGEERRAGRIAELIIDARRLKAIENTLQLGAIVNKARGDSAKTFQALRIAVNDELNNLEKALPQAVEILESGGRLAVISFHSLEDRIVKNTSRSFRLREIAGPVNKKPILPSQEEVVQNPRSRSARLRVIERIAA